MANTIIEAKIEKANYLASEHDVEALAHSRCMADDAVKRTDGAYLRILVARMQADLGDKGAGKIRAKEIEAHRAKLSDIHTALYQAVLRGVTTLDIKDEDGLSPEERRARAVARNSRAVFARSAASTLSSYIKAGGDVRRLEVRNVKKIDLQRYVQNHRLESTPVERLVATANRLAQEAAAIMKDNPEEARAQIEACIATLQALVATKAPQTVAEPPLVEVIAHTQTGVRRRHRPPVSVGAGSATAAA
jgi:ElaB/YqjD/DUF883 family membrane-anchored ribosome-binding protein